MSEDLSGRRFGRLLSLFSWALCCDCGQPTIGGRGHFVECNPSELFKAVFRAARYRAIQKKVETR